MTQDETVRRLCSMASLSGEMAGIAIGLAACQDKEALEAVKAELSLVGRDFGESLSKVGAAARASFAVERREGC